MSVGFLFVLGGLVLVAVALVPEYRRPEYRRRRVRRRTVSRVRAALADWLGPDSAAAPQELSTTCGGGRHQAVVPACEHPSTAQVRRVVVRLPPLPLVGSLTTAPHRKVS